jgi:hypothetical protein
MEGLPIYRMKIDESDDSEFAVDFIALVDRPAIERDFMAFNQRMKFSVDEDRRIVTGALMVANQPIYRRTKDKGEFYVVFEKEEVFKMAQKFMKNGYHMNVNLMHDADRKVEDAFVFESWVVDKERGVQPMKGFEDVEDGSWFVSMKIMNDKVWSDVKSGVFKGFSLEGFFNMERVEETEAEQTLRELSTVLSEQEIELLKTFLS